MTYEPEPGDLVVFPGAPREQNRTALYEILSPDEFTQPGNIRFWLYEERSRRHTWFEQAPEALRSLGMTHVGNAVR